MSTPVRSTPRPVPGPPPADPTRFVPDHLVEALTVTDPALVARIKADREDSGLDRRDEMWDGIYVMSPLANFEHQSFVGELMFVFAAVRPLVGGGSILPGVNVSDLVEGWHKNYRVPDVAVYLTGNPAQNRGTHFRGGPDLAVEILSDNDLARKKLDFYAKVNTREVLILDRDPWALELYRLIGGRLELVGISTPENSVTLSSQVLPLSFRLVPGEGRPTIEIARLDGGQTWRL